MNAATNLQQKTWQPRARWTVLMRGLAPRAVMAAAVGIVMGLPASVVYAHGGDASLVHACVRPFGLIRIVGPSVSCGANERAIDWSITGPAGPAGPAGVAGPPGPAFPITCPPDSVLTGTTCIDTYEASVWETTDAALLTKIQDGTVTEADLTVAGAVQRGLALGDLAAAGCPDTGNGCVNFYAVSIPGVTPSRFLTWFQAAAAARNSGKRLPSNAEWQAAALGTPDPGVSLAGSEDCNISEGGGTGVAALVATGSRDNCVSDVGAFDLVGNVGEWVADWVPLAEQCAGPLFFDDFNCLALPSRSDGPGALVRGGDFFFIDNLAAGVFAVYDPKPANNASENVGKSTGFRAAR